jgi:hypothetical protein
MASRIPLGRALAALVQDDSRETQAERHTRQYETLQAYAWLERQPQGELILDDLALRLTQPCKDAHEEGARRLVLEIFKAIAAGKQAAQEGQP